MHGARRVLSTTIPAPDKVFTKNFMKEFLGQLQKETLKQNTSTVLPLNILTASKINLLPKTTVDKAYDIDFTEVRAFILDDKAKKEALTKEEKKKQAEERKVKRLEYKEKYGYAVVDGQRLEVANWTSEPSCLFAGRGDHPQRGKWKEGPNKQTSHSTFHQMHPNQKAGRSRLGTQ